MIEKVETILTFVAKQQNCTVFAYEDLARKALEQKLEYQQNAHNLTTQLEQVTARIEALRSDLLVIEMTMTEVI